MLLALGFALVRIADMPHMPHAPLLSLSPSLSFNWLCVEIFNFLSPKVPLDMDTLRRLVCDKRKSLVDLVDCQWTLLVGCHKNKRVSTKTPFYTPLGQSILFVYMKIYLYEIHLHTLDYQKRHDCGPKAA